MAESDLKRTIPALEKLAAGYSYVLVDAEMVKESGGRYLRIYIDKPGGITLDDCEIYHRAVVPLVEPIDYDFLEVCSPGLDRPLKTQADFDAHAGEQVEIRLYKPERGSKIFEGTLKGLQDGTLTIEAQGETLTFAQKAVALCRPVIEITEEELDTMDDQGAGERP